MSSATAIRTQKMSGMPSIFSRPKLMSDDGTPLMIAWPCVYQSMKPMMIDAVPSVMMNGSTCSVVLRNPFMAPTAAPMAIPMRMPTTSGMCQCEYAAAVITELSPQMLPIDRSKLPETSVKRMPSVSTPVTAWLEAMFCQLAEVLKAVDVLSHVL